MIILKGSLTKKEMNIIWLLVNIELKSHQPMLLLLNIH